MDKKVYVWLIIEYMYVIGNGSCFCYWVVFGYNFWKRDLKKIINRGKCLYLVFLVFFKCKLGFFCLLIIFGLILMYWLWIIFDIDKVDYLNDFFL